VRCRPGSGSGWPRTRSRIRRERFDVAFDFSLDSRYGLWSKLAGIKKRIGLDYKGRGRFLTDKAGLEEYSGKHAVEYYLDLLNFIDLNCSAHLNVRYSLEVSEEDHIKAKKILAENGIVSSDLIIGIAPGGGASWGKDAIYKQWPAEKFAEVASRLVKELNAKVVLLGSMDESPLTDIVSGKMGQSQSTRNRQDGTVPIFHGSDPFLDLTGKLNLKELAAIISELKLLICNDGGPMHMAVALGVKTVSIFGPVDEVVYGPYPSDAKHVVVKKNLPCRPCYKDFRFAGCSNNRKCIEDITVDEVFEEAKSLL